MKTIYCMYVGWRINGGTLLGILGAVAVAVVCGVLAGVFYASAARDDRFRELCRGWEGTIVTASWTQESATLCLTEDGRILGVE